MFVCAFVHARVYVQMQNCKIEMLKASDSSDYQYFFGRPKQTIAAFSVRYVLSHIGVNHSKGGRRGKWKGWNYDRQLTPSVAFVVSFFLSVKPLVPRSNLLDAHRGATRPRDFRQHDTRSLCIEILQYDMLSL